MKTSNKSGSAPDQTAPPPGERQIVGLRGGARDERTGRKGATFSATPNKESMYHLAQAPKNRSGR